MKIIMIYDQIQSGAGIKDDHDIPLGAKKEAVGPAVMMEPFLKLKVMELTLQNYLILQVLKTEVHQEVH